MQLSHIHYSNKSVEFFKERNNKPAQNQKNWQKVLIICFAHILWHIKHLIFCNIFSLSKKYNHSPHNFSRSVRLLCPRHWQFSCQNHYSSNSVLFIFSPLSYNAEWRIFSHLFTLNFEKVVLKSLHNIAQVEVLTKVFYISPCLQDPWRVSWG